MTSELPSIAPLDAHGFVPALLPQTPTASDPLHSIGFLRGILLFWMIPHRVGPHLAAESLRRALLAFLLAMTLVVGAVSVSLVINSNRGSKSDRSLRESAAELVLQAASSSAQAWLPTWLVGTIPVAGLIGFLALAVCLIPWVADGDRPAAVWKRATTATLWAASALVPMAVIAAAYVAAWMKPAFKETDWETVFKGVLALAPPQAEDWGREQAILFGIVGVGVIWFLNCIFAASRPVGLVLQPREPRCERCGYVIVGLPLDGQCPECLEPVRDSMPGGRRVETIWERDRRRPRGVIALFKTHARVIRSAEFFRSLRVRQGLAAARHFWWTTFALLAAPVIALFVTIRLGWSYGSPGSEFFGAFAAAVAFPLVLQCLMMLAACVWGRWRYGIDDLRMASAVALYSSPLLWFSVLVVPASLVIGDEFQSSGSTMNVFGLGIVVELQVLVAAGFYLLCVIWLIVYWLRICRGLRLVRFANS